MCSKYDQYRAALEGRREDSSRYWTVFGVMSLINGAMLAFFDKDTSPISSSGIALLGVFLCLIWIGLQIRFAAWVKLWESELRRIEKGFEPEIPRLYEDRRLSSSNPLRTGFSTRFLGILLACLFAIAWMVLGAGPSTSSNNGHEGNQVANFRIEESMR